MDVEKKEETSEKKERKNENCVRQSTEWCFWHIVLFLFLNKFAITFLLLCACVCVFVCVCAREDNSEQQNKRLGDIML
jgi:hypothetical protein